jgi:hypothetical protein
MDEGEAIFGADASAPAGAFKKTRTAEESYYATDEEGSRRQRGAGSRIQDG